MAGKKQLGMGISRSNGREMIADMGAALADVLEKNGEEKRKASEIALNVMDHMRKEFGGQNIYFPQGAVIGHDEKYIEIYDKFMAGSEIPQIAYEYGHSIQWIYAVIRSERSRRKDMRDADIAAHRAKNQERWRRES